MPPVISFAEAVFASQTYSRRHVMLGNGFSIACRPEIFVYGKLFERADFSALSPSAKAAFEALETSDFERVIKALRDAQRLLTVYEGTKSAIREAMQRDADGLREVLVNTIAASHPEKPGDIMEVEYAACRQFLEHFSTIYTLNYDLLLYWTLMHTAEDESPNSDNGFRRPEPAYGADYVTWESNQSHDQNIWYLHGALHVFDTGIEIQKYTWINTGVRLIDQIRDALGSNYFPLFVAEGSSSEKLERIRHSDYLAKAYRSFQEITGCLFIFGHSLAENDAHFLRLIERSKSKIKHVFIGLHGDPDSPPNARIVTRANLMANRRPTSKALELTFYDASSAMVWGHP